MKVRKKLKRYANLLLFIFMFYLVMGLSRYAQVLYFQANHHIENFSLSYAALAIAGAFSFLITNQLSGKEAKGYICLFIPIYALGMLLRIVVDSSLIAIISGVCCGIGASAILLLVRQWLLYLSGQDVEDKGFIQSSRFTLMQIASVSSIIIAGAVITLLGMRNFAYQIVLIIAGLLMLLILGLKIPDIQLPQSKNQSFKLLPRNKGKGLGLYGVSILLGMCSSIISSILPAVIRSAGWTVWQTSVITTVATLLTLFGSFVYARHWAATRASLIFLMSQFLVIFFTGTIPIIFGVDQYNLLFLALLVEASMAGFFILKEMMEYEFIPKAEAVIYLGLIQSSFSVGDSLGSLLGGYVFNYATINLLFMIFSGLSLVATGLFYGYHQLNKTQQ